MVASSTHPLVRPHTFLAGLHVFPPAIRRRHGRDPQRRIAQRAPPRGLGRREDQNSEHVCTVPLMVGDGAADLMGLTPLRCHGRMSSAWTIRRVAVRGDDAGGHGSHTQRHERREERESFMIKTLAIDWERMGGC